MPDLNKFKKRGIYVLPILGVLWIWFVMYDQKSTKKQYQDYFNAFDLQFKGRVINIQRLTHDRAKCIILVTESNKKEHIDSGKLWWEYCTLKNDTAYMELTHGSCLEIGDSIFIGPSNRYIIKAKNDTLLVFPNGKDNCDRRQRI
jgi:hypothetical protein